MNYWRATKRTQHRRGLASGAGWVSVSTIVLAAAYSPSSLSQTSGQITFNDIAVGGANGLAYERVRSERDVLFDAIKARGVVGIDEFALAPTQARGVPGVVIFDMDRDNDQDIYVTNGPNQANSLFVNQLSDSGQLTFVDQAESLAVDATEQDSNGACAGDIDNDGDADLLVLGACQAHRLYLNEGGIFSDVSERSGINASSTCASSCSMGDVDNDGLLDIAIANTFSDWNTIIPIMVEPFSDNEHNQLFLNQGDHTFIDVSDSAGIQNTRGFAPGLDGMATITWGIALVDYDQDGDLDLVHADDQAAVPSAAMGGVDRGFIHVFENNGSGQFTDVTPELDLASQGQWMGLSFGDLNCDGHMDIFGANYGDYTGQLLPDPYPLGSSSSRWFLGSESGVFNDPGLLNNTVASVFGWGSAMSDYDNDGDADIVYHGGLDSFIYVDASNPGAVINNHGCGVDYSYDALATSTTNHRLRTVHGFAQGDLNNDGFMDYVSVSNFDIPANATLLNYPIAYGSEFDSAAFVYTFVPVDAETYMFTGQQYPNGTLSVEISEANQHHWIKVRALGTKGITEGGVVNRDGIGSVIKTTPHNGRPVLTPVVSGATFASQHSLETGFGLGKQRIADVEVLWPGGVRNKLHHVRAGETVVFPEIPCSYEDNWAMFGDYRRCVFNALRDMTAEGVLDKSTAQRFMSSAIVAYFQHHKR